MRAPVDLKDFWDRDIMNVIEFLSEIERHFVIGIVGDLGDGKTITGISLLILLDQLYKLTDTPKSVLTNVPINSPFELLEYYDQLEGRKDTLIFMDELHQNADSRQSMKGQNFFTSGITMDVRKFDNKFLWTSQASHQVEKRVRERTLLFIHPKQVSPLIFEIALTNVVGNEYDKLELNLNVFKDLYDTHYKPFPLIAHEA
jgi:ABC-type dipeptide/oligopeptide/nickel transport system ATPase component